MVIFTSCGGGKNTMGSSGRPGKLYEVFYIKNGVTQYFVKPLKMKYNDVKFKIDFTLRSDLGKEGDITCNFSLISKKPIKKVEKASFYNSSEEITFNDLEKVFLEKLGKNYHLRYTSKIKFLDFSKLSKSKFSAINIDGFSFQIPKKVLKNLEKVDESVVEIIELNFED